MIFTETGLAAIQRSIADQRLFNANSREEQRRSAIRAYRGEQLDDSKWISTYIDMDLGDIPLSYTRVTKNIVDKRSLSYKDAPTRTPEGTQVTFPAKYVDASERKDIRLKTLERYTNLLGATAMMPMLVDDKFQYHIINEFRPYFLPNDTHNPYGVLYLVHQDSEPTAGHFQQVWSYWDAEFHFLVDGDGKELHRSLQPETFPENPFGEIPLVFAHTEEIVDDFWTSGMQDVVDANQKIDIALTELNYVLRYQAFGQMYATGSNITGNNIETGYNKFLIVEGDDVNAGVLNFNAPIVPHIEAIKFQMDLVCQNNGISLKWSLSGTPASGFSLMVQNIDLLELREDDIDQWRMFEKDLYRKEKVVWETMKKGNLPDGINTDFAEPEMPMQASEQRAQDDWELEKGLVSIVDLYKEDNPDSGLTDEEITQLLIDNATLNKSVKPLPPVNALANVFGSINPNNAE